METSTLTTSAALTLVQPKKVCCFKPFVKKQRPILTAIVCVENTYHTFFIGSWYMSSSSNVANGLGAADPFPNPGAFLPFPPGAAAFFPLEVIL